MLKAIIRNRTRLAGLAVAAGLVATAGAFGGFPNLVLFAPTSVVGGNWIDGYATGMSGMCTVNCGATLWGSLGDPVSGYVDPLQFHYPTYEWMAPGVATLKCADDDETIIKCIAIK